MKRLSFLAALVAYCLCCPANLTADETADRLQSAKARALDETHELRYKFSPGETVRMKVVHLVTIETKIQGATETAKTRSASTKHWEIRNVDAQGNITFVHTVESVDMWQKMSSRPEVQYNSESGQKPPAEYEHVAASVGKPLATITINPSGQIIKRDSDRQQFNPGIGDLTVPLPQQAIKVGQQWHLPEEIPVRLNDGTVKQIKARQKFTLQKVEAGVATIDIRTEILTPVNDPKVQSQLVQRMQHGTVKFDIDAGRVISKQMDLEETVIGFSGAESMMQYMARLTEESAANDSATAARPANRARK